MAFTHKSRKWQIIHKEELRSDEGQRLEGELRYDTRELLVDPAQSREEMLGTLIHEGLHLAYPWLKEDSVIDGEKLISNILRSYGINLPQGPDRG